MLLFFGFVVFTAAGRFGDTTACLARDGVRRRWRGRCVAGLGLRAVSPRDRLERDARRSALFASSHQRVAARDWLRARADSCERDLDGRRRSAAPERRMAHSTAR